MTALLVADDVDGSAPDSLRTARASPTCASRQAARFILRRQNGDGGFGSYESRRGSLILEYINPSEMYGNCMTERSYTECTASCVGALARFRARFPATLRDEIDRAVARGVQLLRSRQLADGSYLGFWGVNFTYAIFHVVEALRATGVPATDPAIARAIEWLLAKAEARRRLGRALEERADRHATSSIPQSQAAMTAWALLALMEALPPHARRGRARHRVPASACSCADGQWPRQSQSGVFFSTAMLDYRLYKDYFPAWALARFSRLSSS